ncbi:carbon-nitrogen hydrolase family protein [Nocardioides panacis]|uniref:Carbon-nitrogen hydrolase family protein n=1 Tax=Nocardioides panacis TaxID=2849501 RepID=A0A975XZS6_9ACTN|nr:carbon-nitrogen hydrolase family protein [Nocardioides panacis]QWZ07579.1 carbon-nitrogen hydrolase family protein [Nocardioides panacis]
MSSLRLALVQKASSLESAENRAALAAVAGTLEPDTGLVVLPEAFMRDFGAPGSDLAAVAEPLDGPFVAALTAFAAEQRTTVVAGMFERSEDPERPFNTLAVVDRDGLRASYRKIHLYDSFGYKESDRLVAGPVEPVLVDVGGFSVGLMTCYDLRFPELARELVDRGAELLVVPSAWVAGPGKVHHWRTLATARAIENTVYVAAVGQPGPRYTGHSLVVGPAGELVAELGDGDHVLAASVGRDALDDARATNPSLANRRF